MLLLCLQHKQTRLIILGSEMYSQGQLWLLMTGGGILSNAHQWKGLLFSGTPPPHCHPHPLGLRCRLLAVAGKENGIPWETPTGVWEQLELRICRGKEKTPVTDVTLRTPGDSWSEKWGSMAPTHSICSTPVVPRTSSFSVLFQNPSVFTHALPSKQFLPALRVLPTCCAHTI